MRNLILLAAFQFLSLSVSSQSIYKGLEFGMSKKEAAKEFKENKDTYINIDLGNNFLYRIYRQNFKYSSEGLVGVLLSPKGSALGQSYDHAVSYLEYTRSFFEDLGYEILSEPEYWNAPLSFNSKYGLLMVNPDETTIIQLYPVSYGSSNYLVNLEIYNYPQFMEWYDAAQKIQEEKAMKSGF